MQILVCAKWVAGEDSRGAQFSPADQAALEVALQIRDASQPGAHGASEVTVVSLGGPGARHGLRDALARGADRALWVSAPNDLRSDAVAAGIAAAVRAAGLSPDWVVCGDYSADRGSGSVPAFLAAHLEAEQALGLIGIDLPAEIAAGTTADAALQVTRRLESGRREVLAVSAPAVLSVEGSVASLRRASLRRELAAAEMEILEQPGPTEPREHPEAITAYRPRARMLPAPEGGNALDRVRSITAAATASARGETVELAPDEAAERILTALGDWGYLDPSS